MEAINDWLSCHTTSSRFSYDCMGPPNHIYFFTAQKKLAEDLCEVVEDNDVIKLRSLLEQGADPNHQLFWSKEWRKHQKAWIRNK